MWISKTLNFKGSSFLSIFPNHNDFKWRARYWAANQGGQGSQDGLGVATLVGAKKLKPAKPTVALLGCLNRNTQLLDRQLAGHVRFDGRCCIEWFVELASQDLRMYSPFRSLPLLRFA